MRSTRARGVCAPRWLESAPAIWKPTAPARRCSASVHRRAPTCLPRLPTSSFLAHVRKKKRHRACSLSLEKAQHARLRCVRAALVGVGPCPMEAHCASETALSLGARPRSDVPAAVSNKQLSCACAQAIILPSLVLVSLGEAQPGALAMCARRAGWSRFLPYGSPLHQRDGPARPRPRSDVRALTCQPRPATSSRHPLGCTRERATARFVSGGGVARALAPCAICAAWLELVPALWKPTAQARRPYSLVHGRAPTCQPRLPTSSFLAHVRKKKRQHARSLSRENAQHARLRRVRAAPRWLKSVPAL